VSTVYNTALDICKISVNQRKTQKTFTPTPTKCLSRAMSRAMSTLKSSQTTSLLATSRHRTLLTTANRLSIHKWCLLRTVTCQTYILI